MIGLQLLVLNASKLQPLPLLITTEFKSHKVFLHFITSHCMSIVSLHLLQLLVFLTDLCKHVFILLLLDSPKFFHTNVGVFQVRSACIFLFSFPIS